MSERTLTLNRTLNKKIVCSFETEVYRFLGLVFYVSVLDSSPAIMTIQMPE